MLILNWAKRPAAAARRQLSREPDIQALLLPVLARALPGCVAVARLERLSAGASQETYRLEVTLEDGQRHLALRRAAGGVAAEDALGLATEARLLMAARAAGVPAPKVLHVLTPADGLGEGFVMEWLDGETLGARIVRSEALAAARQRLAYDCGATLARIHGIDVAETGLDKLLPVLTPRELVLETWERYKAFDTPQPMIDYAGRWLLQHLPSGGAPRLVHGDFRNGNLMVAPTGIVAVLDWELAQIGDPMRDLGWLCTNSWRFGGAGPVGGFGSYEDLFQGYEDAGGQRVDAGHVRFWEVFGSFWWAIGCLGMADHHRNGPDPSVERPGIGRRSSECQMDCVNLLIPGAVSLPSAPPAPAQLDMPRLDELLVSVRDFLRGQVMDATGGRTRFLARVAANSLDIALRETALGATARAAEATRLQALFDSMEDTATLRWRLTRGLRDGTIGLDRPGLAEHLRQTVAAQLAIDQPKYPALATALAATDSTG